MLNIPNHVPHKHASKNAVSGDVRAPRRACVIAFLRWIESITTIPFIPVRDLYSYHPLFAGVK